MGRRHRRLLWTPGLHVYGQYAWHDDAWIVGTHDALLTVAEALRDAARRGHGMSEVQARDGEGYRVHALRVDGVDRLPLPYTAEHAADRDEERWQRLTEAQDRVRREVD